jgi:transposase
MTLTPQVTTQIAQLLKAGNYRHTAAQAAGVTPGQLEEWLAEGARQEAGPERDLYVAAMEAEHQAEGRLVTIIASAARENWQAAAWLLERRYAGRWARLSQREKDTPEPPSGSGAFAELDELAERRGGRGA